jgi:hypothetical protein
VNGRRRYAVAAARIVAGGVLALVALVPALVYEYGIAISAGLCGSDARWWISAIAITVPLLVVGSWGLLHGWWILVAWPGAVLAAAACLMLASYLQPGAHGYCETMTPYERIESALSRYSTMSIPISSPPRTNRTQSGESSTIRQPASRRL